jgi:hypothetical protein
MEASRNQQSYNYIIELLGAEPKVARSICKKVNVWLMDFMCSLLGDVYHREKEMSCLSHSIYNCQYCTCTNEEKTLSKDDFQRNSCFYIIDNLNCFKTDFTDLKKNKISFRPESIINLLNRWTTRCGLNVNEIDETKDYWINAVIRKKIQLKMGQ